MRAASAVLSHRHTVLAGLVASVMSMSCATLWGFDDATVVDGGALTGDAGVHDGAKAETGDAGVTDATPSSDVAPRMPDPVPLRDAQAPDRGAPPPPPACVPPCGPQTLCALAVGGEPVCVDESTTCNDSSSCGQARCCVWLEADSGTGRCLAGPIVGAGGFGSCLCTSKEMGQGPKGGTCATCAPPAGFPGAGVKTCSSL